jgi:DNA-binding transcriptional LysR family regulator
MGRQIERYLHRLGVKAAPLLEVDATDALVAMVSAGVGWAIATPLCLLQVRLQIKGIKVLPLPGAGFAREIHLIARAGEYGELGPRVAQLARDILKRECLPELRKLHPWMSNQMVVG